MSGSSSGGDGIHDYVAGKIPLDDGLASLRPFCSRLARLHKRENLLDLEKPQPNIYRADGAETMSHG
jgi:hypothetical protein